MREVYLNHQRDSTQLVSSTQGSGKIINRMDMENCTFLKHRTTSELLWTAELKAMEGTSILTECTLRAMSKTIRHKARVNLYHKMKDIHIVGTGLTTCQMDPELRNGLMELRTLEPSTTEQNMETEG